MKWLTPAAAILLSLESEASTYYHHQNKNYALCFVNSHATLSTSLSGTKNGAIFSSKSSYANVRSRRSIRNSFYWKPDDHPRQDTSLCMGIRSIFGLGKKTKDDDEKDRSPPPQDIKAALEAIKADLEAVTEQQESDTSKDELRMNVQESISNKASVEKITNILNPLSKSRQEKTGPAPTSATTYGESVRERIDRVKKGQMTEEEKAAFLRTALTRTPQVRKGPRIRQEIPSPSGISKSASSSASPVRKDSLWNTVMGNTPSSTSSRSRYSGYKNVSFSGKDDSAKREYLDMVTNPDRFKSYAAMGGYKSSSSPNEKNNVLAESAPNEKGENFTPVAPLGTDSQGEALASRLESAAILKEQQDAQARIRKEEMEQELKARQ